MYIVIESADVNKILVAVPKNSSPNQMQGIINLFEKNAVFVQDNYAGQKILSPKITVFLGDKFECGSEHKLLVTLENENGIPEGFVSASPEVFVSNKEELLKKTKRIYALEAELSVAKQKIKELEEGIEE